MKKILIMAMAVLGFATQTLYNAYIAIGCELVCTIILFACAFVTAQAEVLKDYLLHL